MSRLDKMEIAAYDNAIDEAGLITHVVEIAKELEKAYPGHPWLIYPIPMPNGDLTDVIRIEHPMCSANWGYNVVLGGSPWKNKAYIRAAGEILERHNLNRGRLNDDQVMNAPRTLRGNIIGDND